MASIPTTGALHMLKHNGIIAHQTDTVFGLACLPKEKLLDHFADDTKKNGGTIFDDTAWQFLISKIPYYQKFDNP